MIELPTALLLARMQFTFTVGFHFLLPAITIGLASYLAVLEGPRAMRSNLNLQGTHKNGREFPIDVMLSPLDSEAGTFIACAIHDVTALFCGKRTASPGK